MKPFFTSAFPLCCLWTYITALKGKATVYIEDLSSVWAWDVHCAKADEHCALASAYSSAKFHWIPKTPV